MTEDQIHMAVIRHLNARSVPGSLFWHTPNQGNLPVQYRVKLKRMGVTPGVSDLCFVKDGAFFALELKAEKGRPSEYQLEFCAAVKDAGGYAEIGYGLDRSLKILEAWELLK